MVPTKFSFNIAYTFLVNPSKENTKHEPTLTAQELWQGIKRGGRNPHDFADYVHSCFVLSGGRKEFRRRLVLAEGAVHTKAGATLNQNVIIAEGLHVEATTVGTGAKSTFHCSHSAADDAGPEDLYLTAMYELKLPEVVPGTDAARKIREDYSALAKGACKNAVRDIRRWKEEGLLEKWRLEDEALDLEEEAAPA